ncbi:erythrocyte membrane protein band 4.2 [Numida meleagris]|uniref:erythrocyte membrane protein band 4.2 n=1 Tax=Numida meleagris TaxID=8996 RepID=UPI000B3DB953|nr:erythrocyte membrane protein band 4.2 [Numida meleagris]
MGQGLSIKKCDLKIKKNNNKHHTKEISTERLVVRRGQPFTIKVIFSSPVHNYTKQLKKTFLSVQTGSQYSEAERTQVKFPICTTGDQKQWSATLEKRDPYSWTISVNTPANAPIGEYELGSHTSKSYCVLGTFILLFNPWCRDDEVFLPNEPQRQEYILNQDGIIYWGTENEILAQPWDFGQFDVDIVDICFRLLDIGERHQRDKDHTQRKNPIYICRTVAAMMNCDDAKGILTEFGTGECSDGTPPSKWLSSSSILQQWVALQYKPVHYGQCWVFAAVMCSVLRCLGIPTRVVTGFTWAHNTKCNPNVEEYYDEDGALLTSDRSAHLWTFHVWNECWMARSNSPPEYSGWQALDATCQKKSKGLSFCGPAPVQAIKEGDTEEDYDVCYFFAAMNAKCKVWIQKEDGVLKPTFVCTKYTGNNISTKSVGSERCEDITHNYKYPEDSPQEKEVLDKVYSKMTHQTTSRSIEFIPIPTTLEERVNPLVQLQSKSSLILGQDVPLSIEVFNYSGTEKAAELVLAAQSLHYNGVPIMQLWKEKFNFILKGSEVKTLQVFVPYSSYSKELGESRLLRLTAMLRDEDSFYVYFAQEEISICDPPLTIEFPENVVLYQPSTVKISLQNPLTEPLENCVIVVGGRGLIYRQRKYRLGSVQPKSTQDLHISFTPIEAGRRRLTAHLTCLQIQNLKSYKSINVADA